MHVNGTLYLLSNHDFNISKQHFFDALYVYVMARFEYCLPALKLVGVMV